MQVNQHAGAFLRDARQGTPYELAALAMQRGDAAEAARQLATADRLRAEIQVAVPAAERADRERTLDAAQQALGATYDLAALTAGLNDS